jgi:hypothetical protein
MELFNGVIFLFSFFSYSFLSFLSSFHFLEGYKWNAIPHQSRLVFRTAKWRFFPPMDFMATRNDCKLSSRYRERMQRRERRLSHRGRGTTRVKRYTFLLSLSPFVCFVDVFFFFFFSVVKVVTMDYHDASNLGLDGSYLKLIPNLMVKKQKEEEEEEEEEELKRRGHLVLLLMFHSRWFGKWM